MKKQFYPFTASGNRILVFLLFSLLLCGVTSKSQTYTITFPNAPPAVTDLSLNRNDVTGTGIETGVKFRVTQIGTVTAIRFLKGDGVLGTHTGTLWTNAGANLGSATFTETASGWQEVTLPSPVTVTPGTVYVASVFSSLGDYALEDVPGGTWQGGSDYGTSPIIVLAWESDPAGIGNGVYKYVNTPTFPDQNSDAPNYWIDLRFDPTFTLPVNLFDFKAATTNKDIALTWKTSTESSNRGFEVERSNNGSTWYDVGFVNGAGESTVVRDYGYIDKALAPGLYYYRINQVDLDGRSKLSQVITASVSGKGTVSLFSPNPFTSSDAIRFDLPRAQRVRLSVFDMTGREIKVLADNSRVAGTHLVNLNTVGLGRQLYYVRLQTEDGIVTKTILVQ